ncbi:hypothetical protein MHYP_G00342760 [Metynnis hypsauchen]
MVEWTEFERATIQDIFSKMDYDSVGHNALARCLVVYPWTQRYFAKFGNLYNAAAIMGNPMVAAHGAVVLRGLDKAVKNMDNIKTAYAELSVLHSEKLQVDPDNFRCVISQRERCPGSDSWRASQLTNSADSAWQAGVTFNSTRWLSNRH